MSINDDEPTGPGPEPDDDNVLNFAEELARRRANEGEPQPLAPEQIEALYQRCVEILSAHHVETLGGLGIQPIPCDDLALHVLNALGVCRVKVVALAYWSTGERVGQFEDFERRLRDYIRVDMSRNDADKFKFGSIMQREITQIRQRLRNSPRAGMLGFAAHPGSDGDISSGLWPNHAMLISAFNRRHAVTILGGTTVIAERTKRKRKSTTPPIRFIKYRAFLELYANVLIANPNQRGNPVVNGAEQWFTHPNRNQYLDGVVFEPRQRSAPGELNLWRGFGYELWGFNNYELPVDMSTMPRPRGSWSLVRKHILRYLCGNDREVYAYIIQWCARVVQRPWEKGLTFISITGKQGAGKGIFGSTLVRLMGEHGKHFTNPRFFESNFNAPMEGCVFALFDESTFAGSKRQANKLKGMSTEDDLWIEKKGIDPYAIANTLHMMFLTNEEHAALVTPDSRRTVMLKALATMIGNKTYFKNILKQLGRNNDSGYKAMLWDLLTMDLTDFEVIDIPRTAALAEQRALSLEGPALWLSEVLYRGYVYDSRLGLSEVFRRWNIEGEPGDEGPMRISTALMHADYVAFCRAIRDRSQPLNQQRFVMWVQDTFEWEMVRPRGVITGEEMRSEGAKPITDRSNVICFPALAEARAEFRSKMGLDALVEPVVTSPDDGSEPPPANHGDVIPF